MNKFFNFKLPEFMVKYGRDWDNFKTIVDEAFDHFYERIWALYYYRNVNNMPERALEWALKVRKIEFDSSDTFLTKKLKLRKFVSQYKEKGLDVLYLDIQEAIVGTRGTIVSGQSLGVWRWGFSRWHDSAIAADDIRWALSGSQFEIYIDCKTSDSDMLDQIQILYRQGSLLPAFYQIYLVDSSFSILRTI